VEVDEDQPGPKELPKELEAIYLKCVRTKRRERYATAKELADDLRRFQEGKPVTANRGGWLRRLRRKFGMG
jgi:hypothetical protein